jgi:F-type H+-transporting ATPase subunit b
MLPGLLLAALFVAPSFHLHAQEAKPAASAGTASTPEAESSQKNKQEEDEKEIYLHSDSVKAIGAKLGMSPEQAATAFTVANFIVLALLIGWFLIKNLPKTFRDRNSAIQKYLVDARSATEEAKTRLKGVEDRLSKLDELIAGMRAQAEKDALTDEQRIKASVEEEKKKILASAEQEIASATVSAQRQIQQYAAELAIDQAARKLVISAEADRLLIQDFARRLTSHDAKEGQN